MGDFLGHFATWSLSGRDPRYWNLAAEDFFAGLSIVVSLGLYFYTRRHDRDPRFALDLGLLYMIYTAVALGLMIHWEKVPNGLHVFPVISWIGAIVLMRELKGEQVEAWRCQATDALKFSEHLKISNLAQYWREFRNGNFTPFRFIGLLVRGFVMEVGRRTGLLKPLPLHGPGRAPSPDLGLRPGDLVQVRPPAEIESTLDEKGMNRGLSFDREMLPYCGRTVRVKDTVDRIIDDKTGRMLKIPKDSLILEGAVCSGERTPGCWFCPREIYPFWREDWVRPVEGSDRPDLTA